jgi:nitric oxide synthase oxygenase domain/subunit
MSLQHGILQQYKKALDKKNKKNKSGKKQDQSGNIRKKKQVMSQDKSIQQFYGSLTYHYKVESVNVVEVHLDVAYSYTKYDNSNDFFLKLSAKGGWLLANMLPCIHLLAELDLEEVVFHPNTMNKKVWMIDGITPL